MAVLEKKDALILAEQHFENNKYPLNLFNHMRYSFVEGFGGLLVADRDVEPLGLCNDYDTRPYIVLVFTEGKNGFCAEETKDTQEALALYSK